MNWWEAAALGVVQGLTEFFPVSSSGHLALSEAALGVNPRGVAFEVLVHLATLLSVVIVYRSRLAGLVVGMLKRSRDAWAYVGKLALASVPAAAAGLGLERAVAAAFDRPDLVAALLMATGAILWSTRWAPAAPSGESLGAATALWVGCAQALAILPGISRSGSTVAAGLWRGMQPAAAAEFSFLLSVPAILGASALELPDLARGQPGLPMEALIAGFVAATLAGVAAISVFVAWLRRGQLAWFAYYCWAVGGAYLLWTAVAGR